MKKGFAELVFILDRSGSMSGLESDTIGGFNSMIQKQKKQASLANITTVLFDDRIEVIHDRFSLDIIKPLTEEDYYVRGCTSLLDAIGTTIHKIGNIQKHLPDEEKAEKVIFVITTDGLENSSKEYNYEMIKRMIERQKRKYGWEFMFLGANMDAVSEAKKFEKEENRSVSFHNDSAGVNLNYKTLSNALFSMRSMERMEVMDENWKADIEADYKKRGRKEHV